MLGLRKEFKIVLQVMIPFVFELLKSLISFLYYACMLVFVNQIKEILVSDVRSCKFMHPLILTT